jgi:transcriptional regulator with XRE-family HTH domain
MIAAQCKMARAALGLGVRELADLAKVSPDTIARLERGEPLRERTIDAVRLALETAGVAFIAENGGGAGVRLKKAGTGPGSIAAEDLNASND